MVLYILFQIFSKFYIFKYLDIFKYGPPGNKCLLLELEYASLHLSWCPEKFNTVTGTYATGIILASF